MNELARVNAWLYDTLAGDAALLALLDGDTSRIVADVAGSKVPRPFVVYAVQALELDPRSSAGRIMVVARYTIKAVAEARSYAPVTALADRIDALLEGARGPVGDGSEVHVLEVTRDRAVQYAEARQHGRQYRHLGGLYRIVAQAVE